MSKDSIFSPFSLCVHKKLVTFDRPAVMGILNIGNDSFYDGGRYTSVDKALSQAAKLLSDGADIIDIGATSSKPGNRLADANDEISRLSPVIREIRRRFPDAIISVDTYLAASAAASIDCGADIINDISGGLLDEQMFSTVARLQAPYIMMHTTGRPDEMQLKCEYNDIIQDLCLFFSSRLDRLYRLGVKDVWIDPGFGFGKTLEQNYELLDRLDELTSSFREPLLVGVSRKSMIYRKLGITPEEALNGTTVINTKALLRGAKILRVHDPKPALEAINLLLPAQNTKTPTN